MIDYWQDADAIVTHVADFSPRFLEKIPKLTMPPAIDLFSDKSRDVYILGDNDKIKILFEAKTDLSTGSLYSALGQLLIHSYTQDPRPKCVLVVPGKPAYQTVEVLNKIGISVLEYSWEGEKAIFSNLDSYTS